MNPVTNRVYVADYNNGKLLIIDGATNSFLRAVPVGPHPNAVAINPSTNRIYVPTDNVIAVLDGSNDTVVATIPLASPDHFPYRVAVNPITNRVYATSLQGSITVIDGANSSIVTTIAGGLLPSGVASNPVTDRVYVGNMGSGTLSVIPGATNAIETNIFFGPYAVNEVAVNTVTGRVYVSKMDVALHVVDGRLTSPTYNTVLSSLDYPNRIWDLTLNPTTNLIYAMTGSMLVVFDDPPPPPVDSIAALIRWVTSLNLAQGTTNSLDSKLTNAQNALESVKGGDTGTACNKLDSFINEAQAQESKQQLTTLQVRELTVEARLIKSSLGCQ